MEIKWLEDFVSIAQLRSFSKAAVVRHTTQPALSRRLKSLELWYGVPLVDRSTYPIALTRAGENLLPLAQQVVTDIYRSRREARTEAGMSERTVTFSMPHSLAGYFFPPWWRSQGHHPNAKAVVLTADLDDCVEMLIAGACQYLLCYRNGAVPRNLDGHHFESALIGTDRLVPVCATENGRPLFDIPPRRGESIPLLTFAEYSFLGRATGAVYASLEANYAVSCRYESALVEAIKAEALVGEGIAWLPERLIRSELDDGKLVIVGQEDLAVPLEIWLQRPLATATLATSFHGLEELFQPRIDRPLNGIGQTAGLSIDYLSVV